MLNYQWDIIHEAKNMISQSIPGLVQEHTANYAFNCSSTKMTKYCYTCYSRIGANYGLNYEEPLLHLPFQNWYKNSLQTAVLITKKRWYSIGFLQLIIETCNGKKQKIALFWRKQKFLYQNLRSLG